MVSEEFYTVDQSAQRLSLHPKTVLRLIHEGRLRATRIGKAYRVLRSDLDAFAGVAPSRAAAPTRPRARVTAIADIADLSPDQATRLANALQAALVSSEARAEPVQLDTAYDPIRHSLKAIVVASPGDAAALLRMVEPLLEAVR